MSLEQDLAPQTPTSTQICMATQWTESKGMFLGWDTLPTSCMNSVHSSSHPKYLLDANSLRHNPAFEHPLLFQMPRDGGADLSKASWGLGVSQSIPAPQGVAEQGRDPTEGLGAEGSGGSQPSCCSQTGIPFPGFVWCAKGLDQFCSESRGCSTPPQPTPPPAF